MGIIRNFLPQDARSVELPSSGALLLMGVFLFVDLLIDLTLFSIHPAPFWIMFCFTIGGLQLYSLLQYPLHDPLRAAVAWLAGSFWLWIGTSGHLDVDSFASVFLGISNIAAFLINTVILSEKWKD